MVQCDPKSMIRSDFGVSYRSFSLTVGQEILLLMQPGEFDESVHSIALVPYLILVVFLVDCRFGILLRFVSCLAFLI